MLVRYSASDKGSPLKRAEIFTVKEHGIKRRDIDPDAVRIALRLKSAGHSAYVVGGAVRDLLIKRRPKDFDLVTDAHPRRIKRLFRNSRMIGKRFRLVHVYFREKIIELSTFRALNGGEDDTMYGTIQEDVQRRDFTLNALYYCPVEEIVIDYIGGMRDIRKKTVRPLIPLKKIFIEDPVRMIRAVKYSAGLGFRLPFFTRRKIRSQAALLGECSTSRLTEELFKIMQSGYSEPIFRDLQEYGLLKYFLPRLSEHIGGDRFNFKSNFFATLKALDGSINESVERHRYVTALAKDYLEALVKERNGEKPLFKDAYHLVKQFLLPLVPANKDVDTAVTAILRKKKPRLKGPRAGGKPHYPRPATV